MGKAQRRGVPDEVIHSLATPEGDAMLDQFVEIMAGVRRGANDSYPITVNYTLSLAEMIAAGHYDLVNGNITVQRFPVAGEGIVKFEAKLFHFDYPISSEEAVEEIRSADAVNPWELGKIEHLCAFGTKYPEEQCKYSIVGIGSSSKVHGIRSVPCLSGGDSRRDLNLGWWGGGWSGDYRFLAVRKVCK